MMILFKGLPTRKVLWLLLISFCIGYALVFAMAHQMTVLGFFAFFTGLHTLAYFSLKYKTHFYDYAHYCIFPMSRKNIFRQLVRKNAPVFALPYIISVLFLFFAYIGSDNFAGIIFNNRLIDFVTVLFILSQIYLLFAVSFVLIHFLYGRSKKIESWYEINTLLFFAFLLLGHRLPCIIIFENMKWLYPIVALAILRVFYFVAEKVFEKCCVNGRFQKKLY